MLKSSENRYFLSLVYSFLKSAIAKHIRHQEFSTWDIIKTIPLRRVIKINIAILGDANKRLKILDPYYYHADTNLFNPITGLKKRYYLKAYQYLTSRNTEEISYIQMSVGVETGKGVRFLYMR